MQTALSGQEAEHSDSNDRWKWPAHAILLHMRAHIIVCALHSGMNDMPAVI